MTLVKTDMEPSRLQRNEDDYSISKNIAESGDDGPVLMLNMNRYTTEAAFPDGELYNKYVEGLGRFLESAGAKVAAQPG